MKSSCPIGVLVLTWYKASEVFSGNLLDVEKALLTRMNCISRHWKKKKSSATKP